MKQENLEIGTLEKLADYIHSQRVEEIHEYMELWNEIRFIKYDLKLIMHLLYKFMIPRDKQNFDEFYKNRLNEELISYQDEENKKTVTVRSKDGSFENTYKINEVKINISKD